MEDTYVGIIHFETSPPAAEFKYAHPVYWAQQHYSGSTYWVFKTHFRLNFDSLRTRISNLKMPKNGAPHDLSQEFKAEKSLLPAHIDHNL